MKHRKSSRLIGACVIREEQNWYKRGFCLLWTVFFPCFYVWTTSGSRWETSDCNDPKGKVWISYLLYTFCLSFFSLLPSNFTYMCTNKRIRTTALIFIHILEAYTRIKVYRFIECFSFKTKKKNNWDFFYLAIWHIYLYLKEKQRQNLWIKFILYSWTFCLINKPFDLWTNHLDSCD